MEDIQMLIKMLECTATEKAALKKRCEIQRITINRLLDENKELLLKVREYENDEFCKINMLEDYFNYSIPLMEILLTIE